MFASGGFVLQRVFSSSTSSFFYIIFFNFCAPTSSSVLSGPQYLTATEISSLTLPTDINES